MEEKKTTKKSTSKKTNSDITKEKKPIKKESKKNTTRKKTKRKRAFTLIELLAVIIILGILMIIAIPSVTTYINNSRKSAYVDTAKNIVSGTRNMVNEGKLGMYDTSATYYIPYDMINTENGATSPYGEITEGYVVVTFDGKGYDYYFTSIDETKTGMYLTYYDKIDNDRIESDMKSITTDIAICGKENVIVFNKNGNEIERKNADDCIDSKEIYDGDDCPYKLVTEYGSFSKTEDVKEVCVKLIDDYSYVYYEAPVQYGRKYEGSDLIMNVDLPINAFNPSSYIRVYNNSNKERLLGEVTKNDYSKYDLDITQMRYVQGARLQKSMGQVDEFYVEMSSDIKKLVDEDPINRLYFMYSSGYYAKTYNGPWIKNSSDLLKIDNLEDSLYDFDMDLICTEHSDRSRAIMLRGFTNCENEEESNCSGNVYHAKYYIYCDGIPK